MQALPLFHSCSYVFLPCCTQLTIMLQDLLSDSYIQFIFHCFSFLSRKVHKLQVILEKITSVPEISYISSQLGLLKP